MLSEVVISEAVLSENPEANPNKIIHALLSMRIDT